MRVRVYRNLHNNLYSVRHKGRVIGYVRDLLLYNVKFIVSQAGRNRVLREQRKNVHAFVEGDIEIAPESFSCDPSEPIQNNVIGKRAIVGDEVRYNPYEGPDFIRRDNGSPIKEADVVLVTIYEGMFIVSLPTMN